MILYYYMKNIYTKKIKTEWKYGKIDYLYKKKGVS